MELRFYQDDAVNAAIAHIKKSVMPACMELATGAGKSLVVAALAKWVHETTGKRVLCLQPSKELTEQNHAKFLRYGNKASLYSASVGRKCLKYPVVYGTPLTVKNGLNRFGDQFGLIIVDEAHGLTPTIREIIAAISEKNKLVRVLGLTATPYTMQTGYIYQYDIDGTFMDEAVAREPYFNSLLYRITAPELIALGYLTKVVTESDHAASYNTESLELKKNGKFDDAQVDKVFVGRGRLTSEIVADIVSKSHNKRGVMIFAATVQHAKEIMESLDPANSAMVAGDVNMGNTREDVLDAFKAMRYKYLVSVGALTTGVDFPHVDVIAVMRATESPGLLQQIIGRGIRLFEDKEDCLLLDYAKNIERHDLFDNLFEPEIKAKLAKKEGCPASIECPDCGYVNAFGIRPDFIDHPMDAYGYALDLEGVVIETEHGPMPVHYGRRCTGQVKDYSNAGLYVRCEYRWTDKKCYECNASNDIAARYCSTCKAEIVDPNEKLQREFMRIKKDPYSVHTDKVLEWSAVEHTANSGKIVLLCNYVTDYRKFKVYYTPDSRHPFATMAWNSLCQAVFKGRIAPSVDAFLSAIDKGTRPLTITYRKQQGSKFFEAINHNQPEDTIK